MPAMDINTINVNHSKNLMAPIQTNDPEMSTIQFRFEMLLVAPVPHVFITCLPFI